MFFSTIPGTILSMAFDFLGIRRCFFEGYGKKRCPFPMNHLILILFCKGKRSEFFTKKSNPKGSEGFWCRWKHSHGAKMPKTPEVPQLRVPARP